MKKLFALLALVLFTACATTQPASSPAYDNDNLKTVPRDEELSAEDREILENAEKMARRIKENLEAMDKDLERVRKYAGSQPASQPSPDCYGDEEDCQFKLK